MDAYKKAWLKAAARAVLMGPITFACAEAWAYAAFYARPRGFAGTAAVCLLAGILCGSAGYFLYRSYRELAAAAPERKALSALGLAVTGPLLARLSIAASFRLGYRISL